MGLRKSDLVVVAIALGVGKTPSELNKLTVSVLERLVLTAASKPVVAHATCVPPTPSAESLKEAVELSTEDPVPPIGAMANPFYDLVVAEIEKRNYRKRMKEGIAAKVSDSKGQ